MAHITLNKKYFFNNLDIIATKTKSRDKIALVLKDNAYGHGILEVASMAKEYGISKAVVRCGVEAKMVEEYFEYILVLAEIPHATSKKIRYTINDIEHIERFPHATLVELKVDTGMHRNGVPMERLEEALKRITQAGLLLDGVFTHHRSADELSSEWYWQKRNFEEVKERVVACGFRPRFHSANSAALFRHVDFDEDMTRVGIAAYGCLEMPEGFEPLALKPILSLYAHRNSKRLLKAGERVGYGAMYEVQEDCVVSNYDIGYGDGFFRSLSNRYTTPHNKRLVGRISMDNSSYEADDEELLIFDDASKVAKEANTISYEVLTSLKHSIKRRVI